MICKNCGAGIDNNVNYCGSCGEGAPSMLKVSSWKKRLSNVLIDFVVIIILQIIIQRFFGILAAYIVFPAYYFILESTTQRTIGKLITKTKVVRRDGEKPNFVQILGRTFSRYIPFEAFSFFSHNPTGWHDRFPKTFVVSNKYSKEDVNKIAPEKRWR